MEQLPENDAPQIPSEHQPTETEIPRPSTEQETAPTKSEPLMETSEAGSGREESEEPATVEAASEQPAVESQEPAGATASEGAETEVVEAKEAPTETTDTAPAAEAEATIPSVEAEATVPSAEAEEGKPESKKQAVPARPEKPAGPRLVDMRPGMVVEGTVTRVEKYGAFVNLGLVERRDGLIHISELAPYRIRRVEDVVQVGSPVRARIVSVDMGRGRIALSLNDVDEETASEASAGPSEPALTAMAMAFQQAQSRRAEQERSEVRGGEVGSRKKREQEELMRKFRSH